MIKINKIEEEVYTNQLNEFLKVLNFLKKEKVTIKEVIEPNNYFDGLIIFSNIFGVQVSNCSNEIYLTIENTENINGVEEYKVQWIKRFENLLEFKDFFTKLKDYSAEKINHLIQTNKSLYM